jgi:hypothetical protein
VLTDVAEVALGVGVQVRSVYESGRLRGEERDGEKPQQRPPPGRDSKSWTLHGAEV